MKPAVLASSLFGLQAVAFPAVYELVARQGLPSTKQARAISKARTNCGPTPCLTFDAASQYVSTSGNNEYRQPVAGQIRGPCPGLNAAANHNYLPRSGIATIPDTITGLGALYGMSPELAAFLAAYAVIFDGDPILGTWSIGGPPPADPITGGLLGGAQGISYSHNVYEGDCSIARFDAYLNHGVAQELSLDRFRAAYEVGMSDDRYTLDKFVQDFTRKAEWSIANNPYYFAAPFSTTLVSPAAYNFVINFMSNHTAEEPSGYLNGAMFQQFFAIEGTYPNFKWLPGQERVPDNWYRRPTIDAYNAANVVEDVGIGFLAYPASFRLGGNTNGVNTYSGISLSNLTGGVYNSEDLFNFKNTTNAICFFTSLIAAGVPASLNGPELAAIRTLISQYVNGIIPTGVTCPALNGIDDSLFDSYPGYSYMPTGPATTGGPSKGDNKPDCCGKN